MLNEILESLNVFEYYLPLGAKVELVKELNRSYYGKDQTAPVGTKGKVSDKSDVDPEQIMYEIELDGFEGIWHVRASKVKVL